MQMQAELDFMRELMKTSLPVGDKKKEMEDYFSFLEEAICNNDQRLRREEFPPDNDSAIGGERVYKYHSATQFKELASRPLEQHSGQDLGHPESKQTELPPTPDIGSSIENVACDSEHRDSLDSCERGENGNCVQGKLDPGHSGDLHDDSTQHSGTDNSL